MLGAYFRAITASDVQSKSDLFGENYYPISLFHKLPLIRSRIAKCYGCLWVVYKMAFVLFLFYDLKLAVIVLSFLNPASMFVMDFYQFQRMQTVNKVRLDKLYLLAHIVVDLILLLNAGFVMLVEWTSNATHTDESLLQKLDEWFWAYRIFLATFVYLKFAILVVEFLIFRRRSQRIYKSS